MGNQIEAPLPCSAIHERWLLGAILTPCTGFEALFDFLREDDFYPTGGANARIFRAMRELRDRGLVVDLLSVDESLRADGVLESIGGTAYLAALADGIARVAPLTQWARALREHTNRRQLIEAADLLRERAFDASNTTDELLEGAIARFGEMVVEGKDKADDGMSPFDADVALLSELRDDRRPRIFTGIHELDTMLGGFLPGELWVFAAATGVGKTLLAQQTRRRACARGYHTVFCSGEMSSTQLQRRELARAADVPQGKMRVPETISADEFRRLIDASAHDCKECRLLTGELTIPRIRSYARWRKAQGGLSLIIIDYDELVNVEGDTENDQARILARAAKAMGMELDCPVILVSQLRKSLAGEDLRRPTLQSIYGSGAKTKHGTGVLLIDRPWVRDLEGDETDAHLYVLKNRDGRLGRIPCVFDVRTLEFSDGEKRVPAVKKKTPVDASLFRHPAEPREAES